MMAEYLEKALCRVKCGAGGCRLDTESWSLYTDTLPLVSADTELVSDW